MKISVETTGGVRLHYLSEYVAIFIGTEYFQIGTRLVLDCTIYLNPVLARPLVVIQQAWPPER